MKAPIQSSKHYIQKSLTTVAAGALHFLEIAQGIQVQNIANPDDVAEGSVIKAVYVEMWIRAGGAAGGNVVVSLIKEPLNIAITFAQHIALNNYENKKNVFYHTQGLTNQTGADAIPFVRQWIKIPKGKQRFALGDKLVLAISAQALAQDICGFAVYKEYN